MKVRPEHFGNISGLGCHQTLQATNERDANRDLTITTHKISTQKGLETTAQDVEVKERAPPIRQPTREDIIKPPKVKQYPLF
jgi:hypothetical protein